MRLPRAQAGARRGRPQCALHRRFAPRTAAPCAHTPNPFSPAQGAGSYGYLREPLWWAGLLAMVLGEAANFAAYAFAPAILVTPLGALSIIIRCGVGPGRVCVARGMWQATRRVRCRGYAQNVRSHTRTHPRRSAVLADALLGERLNLFGWVGCGLCINGSVTIVLHAPPERPLISVQQVWDMAMQPGAQRARVLHVFGRLAPMLAARRRRPPPLAGARRAAAAAFKPACPARLTRTPPTIALGFLLYAGLATVALVYLIYFAGPKHGTTNIFVYLGICSTAGSLSVVSCKALGVAVKLTLQGSNQLADPHTLVFVAVRGVLGASRGAVVAAAGRARVTQMPGPFHVSHPPRAPAGARRVPADPA